MSLRKFKLGAFSRLFTFAMLFDIILPNAWLSKEMALPVVIACSLSYFQIISFLRHVSYDGHFASFCEKLC